MKIRGWHIEGFGIHRDWRVEDVAEGLNVFYGPNEAGKSTLLAFLRGVLFGYPDGRSSEPKYVPKGGVAHGGRVTLRVDSGAASGDPPGDVVVERFAGRSQKVSITLEDGRAGDVSDLAQRLGHADARLFRNVFAFGLQELQELGSLGEAGIQDHLFAAGVTGGGRSAREAVRELREAARELFDGVKGRKKHDRARVLVRAIADVKSELFIRQEAAERYPDLRDAEQALATRLRQLESEAEAERALESRARKLTLLWNEIWSPLAEAREQAAKLAPSVSESLPRDAQSRLEHCLKQIQRDQERVALVRTERSALAAQLQELRLDEPARVVAVRVAGLQDRLALHRNHRARWLELDTQRAECDERVASALERLFPEATSAAFGESELRAVQSTALRREELREWKTRVDAVHSELRDGAAAGRLLDRQLGAARGRVEELDERLGAQPAVDVADLDRRGEAVRALRVLTPRLRELEADQASRSAGLTQDEAGRPLLSGGAPVAGMLAVAAVLAAAAFLAATAFVVLERFDLLLIEGLALGAVLVAQLQRVRARQRLREDSGEVRRAALLEASRRVEEERAQAAPHLASLGLSVDMKGLDEAVLTAQELELVAARERAGAVARIADELREARSHVVSLEGQLASERERAGQAQVGLDALEVDFGVWKSQVGVPSPLGVEAATEFVEETRRGRDALDERDRLTSDQRRVAAEIDAWNGEVDAVLRDAAAPRLDTGLDRPQQGSDDERIAALLLLRDRCAADRVAREGRELLERRGVDLRDRLVACEETLAGSRAALSALLEDARVEDVSELQRHIAIDAEATALGRRVSDAEAELARRLEGAGSESAAELREELAQGRVDEWEEQAAGAHARVTLVQTERDEVLREHQDRVRDRKRLEESTDLMDFELQKAALEQELREVLDEWRHLRVSASLIEEALDRFEGQHQPGVLREASELFARVTASRYPRIVASESRAGFAVLTQDGAHRDPAELSQGTREQLYLCIRLGLVAELARADRALPVVMDDVLVNFDDDRAAAMAEVLARFAADHQLFFFTCSSRTRDLLAATGPAVDVRPIGEA